MDKHDSVQTPAYTHHVCRLSDALSPQPAQLQQNSKRTTEPWKWSYVTNASLVVIVALVIVVVHQQFRLNELQNATDNLRSHVNVLYQLRGVDCADAGEAVSKPGEPGEPGEPSHRGYAHYSQASRQAGVDREVNDVGGDDADDDDAHKDEVSHISVTRTRRSTTNITDSSQRSNECNNNNQCSIHALHLYASKQHVMSAMSDGAHASYIGGEDVLLDAGTISKFDGFRPSSGPLKVWDSMRWPASRYEYFADITRTGRDGIVKITKTGLYLIYVQVTFQTAALHQSISLYCTGCRSEEPAVIGSCMVSERFQTVDISERDSSSIYLLCPITTTYYLHAGSGLHLESTYEGRRIMLNQFLTYWGIIYLN